MLLLLQKEELNNLLPTCKVVGVKEKIKPSVKELSAGNNDTRSASSICSLEVQITEQHEQRLTNLENMFAQHDLIFKEHLQLKQDNLQLKQDNLQLKQDNLQFKQDNLRLNNELRDVTRKVDYIEEVLTNALRCQKDDYDFLQGHLNALQNEQVNLRAQFSRLMENPLSHEERDRLIRNMEAIQERIGRLERHLLSHRNMLTNISTSVRSLANAVASDRVPGVDIQPV